MSRGVGDGNRPSKVSERLRKCMKCRKVWEIIYQSNKEHFLTYEDFPSYGLKRKTCRKCNGR